MQVHKLVPKTPEWLAYRAQHFNASDAPAMMGCSPHETRDQLLHRLHTGLAKEFSDFVQERVINPGHDYEALARQLAAKIIGEDLYQVTASEGELSASFDGLTIGDDVAWEHKRLNATLRACMGDGFTAADLPLYHRVQMEHQCMVAKCGQVLFMASEWDDDGNLIEERHCWYNSDAELAEQIRAGWHQFAKDLAAYRAPEVVVQPVAEPIMALPALSIQLRGEVVASNLAAYREAAAQRLATINTDLKTDDDFAQAKATVKWCEDAEGKLEAAKEQALGQTSSIDELLRTIDNVREQLRRKRLDLDKLVKAREAQIKEGILMDGRAAYNAHLAELNAELGTVKLVLPAPDFAGAMHGKRTIASLRDAVNTTLAKAKIDADAAAKAMRAKLSWLAEAAAGFEFLFPPADLQALAQKPLDDFQVQVTARIDNHKARLAHQERERLAEEQRQRDAAEQARQQAEAAQQVQAQQPATPPPAPAVVPISARRTAAPAPAAPPTLTLGKIAERLGFSLTAAQLQGLGIAAAGKDRGATLYHDADFTRICDALIERIQQARQPMAA